MFLEAQPLARRFFLGWGEDHSPFAFEDTGPRFEVLPNTSEPEDSGCNHLFPLLQCGDRDTCGSDPTKVTKSWIRPCRERPDEHQRSGCRAA